MDIFRPEQWHDFFIMVGGGAAALAGLVFVAMSINLGIITRDPTHKNRAIGTLTGFTAVFMICAFVLIGGQNHKAIGIEWLGVSVIATYIYIRGYIRAIRIGRSSVGLRIGRLIFGTVCYVTQVIGSSLFIFGHIAGLYIASIAMVVSFASLISGAWLLIVGIHEVQLKVK
ncbi:MAG: hypothetical protein WDN47_02595 [Candidatus Doudnabacteria bacterium]